VGCRRKARGMTGFPACLLPNNSWSLQTNPSGVRGVDNVRNVRYACIMKKTKQRESKQATPSPSTGPVSAFPEPHDLLKEAEREVAHGDLKNYATVIATLRKKGFSFREIAEWLNARGLETNHNAVYRVFTTCLARGEAEAIEDNLEELRGE